MAWLCKLSPIKLSVARLHYYLAQFVLPLSVIPSSKAIRYSIPLSPNLPYEGLWLLQMCSGQKVKLLLRRPVLLPTAGASFGAIVILSPASAVISESTSDLRNLILIRHVVNFSNKPSHPLIASQSGTQ